jgi:hypothetical protein
VREARGGRGGGEGPKRRLTAGRAPEGGDCGRGVPALVATVAVGRGMLTLAATRRRARSRWRAVGSPRARRRGVGSPRARRRGVGSPRAAVGSPRAAVGSPPRARPPPASRRAEEVVDILVFFILAGHPLVTPNLVRRRAAASVARLGDAILVRERRGARRRRTHATPTRAFTSASGAVRRGRDQSTCRRRDERGRAERARRGGGRTERGCCALRDSRAEHRPRWGRRGTRRVSLRLSKGESGRSHGRRRGSALAAGRAILARTGSAAAVERRKTIARIHHTRKCKHIEIIQ